MKILIVIPAYNEEKIIKENILKTIDYLQKNFSREDWLLAIADNNSNDKTKEIVQELAKSHERLRYFFVAQKGKGNAVKTAWLNFDADIYCFMDADLATELTALPGLIQAISREGFDMACGSRFARGSVVKRSGLRKMVSHGYRLVLKLIVNLQAKDAPCGFKAINKKIKNDILPMVRNTEWFFDSELLILAEKLGYKIKEIPINWREPTETGRSSQVKIISLSLTYIKKALEIRQRLKRLDLDGSKK